MGAVRTVLVVAVLVAGPGVVRAAGESAVEVAQSSIPYVASHSDTVADMLWMADVGPNDVVYDLGSGDGRIVIAAVRDFGARRAVGVEIDGQLVQQSRASAREAGIADRVQFIEGDLFEQDLRDAGVVTLFLGHEPNIRLRPKLLSTLKPGTRVVSHQFGMGEWQPEKLLAIRSVVIGMYGTLWSPFQGNSAVPDYTGNETYLPEKDNVMMWLVPAPVAGVWSGTVDTGQGPQACRLVLHQRLSRAYGECQWGEQSGQVAAEFWGDRLRFGVRLDPNNIAWNDVRFDGHVHGDTMTGTLAVKDRGRTFEGTWQAHRERVDYTGVWEWPCATGDRSVRLHIERRDGQLVATYQDRDQIVPVPDVYDFGGGFYFTLLIGRQENHSIRIAADTGWLIGEGVLDEGTLKGRIEFHPSDGTATFQEWTPRLVAP